jgi:anti-sigma factor RsiW
MTADPCAEMRLLIQADIDGELAPAESARVGSHLETCASCAEVQVQLLALAAEMRQEVAYHSASAALHLAVRGRIAARAGTPGPRQSGAPRLARLSRRAGTYRGGANRGGRLAPAAFFGSGFALAAGLGLLLLLPGASTMPDSVVSDHIRALQPGHLIDIASTDQHTVKPWFDGKLDFAPPVKDFALRGFPLTGGRLDYLAGQPVAAMIYQHGQHIIDLYAWPTGARHNQGPSEGSRSGYNFVHWEQDGMTLWAVSDLNGQELADFVRYWQKS